jgi:hypothetical protein
MNVGVRFFAVNFAILFVIICLPCGASDQNSSLKLDPTHIFINGTLGTDSFKGQLNVTAEVQDITGLRLSPGSLRMNSPVGPWAPTTLIPSTSIQISPTDAKDLKKGSILEYDVIVQNIPRSGRYTGRLYFTYNQQPIGIQETVPITLVAYKLNASPITVDFVNSPLGFLGASAEKKEIELREDSGHAPPEVIKTLADKMNASMEDLVGPDGKSLGITGTKIFKQWDVGLQGNRSIILYTNFTNPKLDAGKYVGTIRVYSDDSLWPAISIPVEIRVSSMPGWLAIILIFFGVVISFIIGHWNTKGREKNGIKHEIGIIRDKSRGVMTVQCHEKIEKSLGEIDNYLYNDNFKEAHTELEKTKKDLESCIVEKKKLDEMSEIVSGLIKKLEEIKKRATIVLKGSGDSETMGTLPIYLKRQCNDLLGLHKKADGTFYNSVDEKKWDLDEEGSAEKSLSERAKERSDKIAELAKLIARLERLKEVVDSYDQDRRKVFDSLLKINIIDFRNINNREDVTSTLAKVEKRIVQFSDSTTSDIIDLLNELRKNAIILNWEKGGDKLNDLMASLENCDSNEVIKTKLREIKDEFKKFRSAPPQMDVTADTGNIINKIDRILNDKGREEEPTVTSKLEISVTSNPASPFTIGQTVTFEATAKPDKPNRRIKYNFSIEGSKTGWTTDNEFRWTPREWNDPQSKLEVRARYEDDPTLDACNDFIYKLKRKEPNDWDRVKLWWTPEREKRCMEWSISIIAFVLATAIAYGQLYANNPTYGAGKTWMGYVTLVLWGFGVDASTTKATEFFKTLSV